MELREYKIFKAHCALCLKQGRVEAIDEPDALTEFECAGWLVRSAIKDLPLYCPECRDGWPEKTEGE